MVIFTVFAGRRMLSVSLTLIFLLGCLSVACLIFFPEQPRPVRIGLNSPCPALAEAILSNFAGEVEVVPLSEGAAEQLARGELDYYLSGQEVQGFEQQTVGQVVAAVVASCLNPREEITLQELENLLAQSPEQVLISEELALEDFFWFEHSYLPTKEVIDLVATGDAFLGLIPLQRRVPALQVLAVDRIDPRGPEVLASKYPLKCRLTVQKRPLTWRERLQELVGRGQEDYLLSYLQSSANAYWDPWHAQAKFGAAGDVMLDRDVKKAGLEKGWEWIFAEAAPLLRGMDLAFCNLECPIGSKGKFINMFQAPPEAIAGISYAGFDVVSLANNHILDYHHEGMQETMAILTDNSIAGVGAGRNIHEARKPVIMEVNGITIGFVAYTEMWFVHAREPISWQATEEEPGVAPARLEYVAEDIADLRDKVDIIVASFHWGKEYADEPTTEQKALARGAVDAGADLVLGHHPHVLQGIEFYKQGVIAYSLGNFVFDQRLPKTQESMVLEFTLSKRGVLDMTIHPAYIQGMQPIILEGNRKSYLYNRIRGLSLDRTED